MLSRLTDHCRNFQLSPPIFSIVSDRRGGRTAWSSTVTISGHHVIQARYWYDGQYVNNAKEDAAEVALQQLMVNRPNGSGGSRGGAVGGGGFTPPPGRGGMEGKIMGRGVGVGL